MSASRGEAQVRPGRSRRSLRAATVLLAAATLAVTASTTGTVHTSLVAGPATGPHTGPPYDYTTELKGEGKADPLNQQASLTRTEHGYLYRAGQQDSHLVIELLPEGVRFADSGTARFKELASSCQELMEGDGVAALCALDIEPTEARPLLLEVWPRLGDDFVDGSRLPATVAMAVLGDAGNDEVRLGAGPDFFNGAAGNDRVWGGDGNDWLRSGDGNDRIWGGAGDDLLVGVDGNDRVWGGDGDDRLGGGPGNDRLFGGEAADHAVCGDGHDRTRTDAADRPPRDCELVRDR